MGQRSQDNTPAARRRGGSKREFESFVARTTPGLSRTAYLMTWDEATSEDLLQEAFMKVAQRWPRVRAMDHPYAYARRVLVNLALDSTQRRARHRQELSLVDESMIVIDDDARQALEQVTEADAIGQALARLTPRQRMVLVLRYWEDLSEADVAQLLHCSTGTVKSTASRAAARLATELATNAHPSEHPALATITQGATTP
jgi:RNA polymerase sigma-70 factor (sigma-E family)